MIDLYFWMTPNGYKVSILLEEIALPYRVITVGKYERREYNAFVEKNNL